MRNKKNFYWQDEYLKKYNLSMSQIINDIDFHLDENRDVSNNVLLFLKNDIPKNKVKSTIEDMGLNLDFLLEKWNKVSVLNDLLSHKKIKSKNLENKINDYSDNFVAYREGDEFGKLLFDIAVSKGCCGNEDLEVYIKDDHNNVVKWYIHFNFGH